MIEVNKAASDRETQGIVDGVDATQFSVILACALSVAAALLCGLLLTRSTTGPLRQVITMLGVLSSQELAAARP